MVIPFDRHIKRKQEREEYKRELIARILEYYQSQGVDAGDSYLDHVKTGFPIEILENIVQKLDQEQAANTR